MYYKYTRKQNDLTYTLLVRFSIKFRHKVEVFVYVILVTNTRSGLVYNKIQFKTIRKHLYDFVYVGLIPSIKKVQSLNTFTYK